MDKKVYRVGIVGLTGIVAKEVQETDSPFREEIVHGHAAGLSVIDGFDFPCWSYDGDSFIFIC